MKRLNVCVVTGTRAEFGIWRPVLRAIEASARLRLRLVATGMHLQKEFGETVREIGAEGFAVAARVPMYKAGEAAAASLARGVEGLAAAYRGVGADLVMVLGDRLEMLAAGSAALAERMPLAHVHGGETAPGVWDEQIRHALTKMAHVHFCATAAARGRILRMGEPPGRVHLVGAPALDLAEAFYRECAKHSARDVERPEGEPSAVVALHPSGGTDREEQSRAELVLKALRAEGVNFLAVGPNNDPGHRGILRAYRQAGVEVTMSLGQDAFWARLMAVDVLVGNSSAGIIEAATFGLPVVNVGGRQAGRERNANVLDVPFSAAAVRRGVRKALTDRAFLARVRRRKNLYGDGRAAGRIVGVLEQLAAGPRRAVAALVMKRFADGRGEMGGKAQPGVSTRG